MVRNLYMVFEKTIKFFGKWTAPAFKAFVLVFFVGAVLALVLYKIDREALFKLRERFSKVWGKVLVVLLVIAVLILQFKLLNAVRNGVIQRIKTEVSARFSRTDDPGGGATTQYSPSAAYRITTTRNQRLTISSYTLRRLGRKYGINYLPDWSPRKYRYDRRPVLKIDDRLEKEDNRVVLHRDITFNRYMPLKVYKNDIHVKLEFHEKRGGEREQFYKAEFNGKFSFKNPYDERKNVRFTFPLPRNSGALTEFRFRVNGKDFTPEDVSSGCKWEGEIGPNEEVNVVVHYKHNGAKSWTYHFSKFREPVTDFKLTVESTNAGYKFKRGVIYPTSIKKSAGKTILEWSKKGLIASQSISIYFPGKSLSEMVTRMYIFSPIALLGFVLMIWLWGGFTGHKPSPYQLIFASLVYSGGFALASYLLKPTTFGLAVLLSFLAVGAINWKILGNKFLPVLIIFTLVPLAFVFSGFTGIILSVLGLASVGYFFLIRKAENEQQPAPQNAE